MSGMENLMLAGKPSGLLRTNLKILIVNCLEKVSTIYHCGAGFSASILAGIFHEAKKACA